MNNVFHSYDANMLDATLIANKEIHKSPLVYLEEILIYNYDIDDIVQCGRNYKENALSSCNDGLSNTLTYYINILKGKVSQPVLERFLNYLIQYKYCIFYIGKAVYLVSTAPEYIHSDLAIRMDTLVPEIVKANGMYGFDERDLLNWDNLTVAMNFDDSQQLSFKNNLCATYNHDDLPFELKTLLDEKGEYKVSVDTQVFSVTESVDFDNDFNDFVLEPATEARKTKSPEEKIEDGLSSLEDMSDDSNSNEEEGDDGSNQSSTVDNTKETRNTQNDVIDAAGATNDQMESDGQDTMDDMSDDSGSDIEDDDGAGDGETDDNSEDDSNSDDEFGDDNSTEDDPLNDPHAKKKYHEKLKKLYKHINDTIDTLETFTPAYDSDYVDTYYKIQNNFARLRSAIFRICTETINDLDVVDLMKKYSSANMAYDSLIQMFKDFMVKYKQERNKNKK